MCSLIPQANAAGMFVDMAGIDGERYRSVATPIRISPSTDHIAEPGSANTSASTPPKSCPSFGLS